MSRRKISCLSNAQEYIMLRIKSRNCEQEQGVFIAIVAVSISVLCTFFIVLNINTHLIRQAQSQLSLQTEQICNALVEGELSVHGTTARTFAKQVRSLKPLRPEGFVTITRAQLTEPTFPPGYIDYYKNSSLDLEAYLEGNTINYDGVSFRSLGVHGCDLCFFRSNVTHPRYRGSSEGDEFPVTFWNNLENAGTSVACELEAEVNQIFQKKPVTVRAIASNWKRFGSREMWRDFVSLNQDPSFSAGRDKTAPGLVIGVATHMTTRVDDDRFRFPYAVPTGAVTPAETPGSNFLPANYIPGKRFFTGNETLIPTSFDWDWTTKEVPYTVPIFDDEGNFLRNETRTRIEWYYKENANNPPASEQLTYGCENPAVLARNAYASTFLELASRNGHLRWSTELISLGTMDYDFRSRKTISGTSNPPVRIVEFGEDLLKPDYYLPRVRFNFIDDSGRSYAVPGSMGMPGTEEADDRINYLLTLNNQLRNCFHMYTNSSIFGSPVTRFTPEREFSGANVKFEDSVYRKGNVISRAGNKSKWAQTTVDGISAPEIASVLGTTQICPHRSKLSFNTVNDKRVCVKPRLDDAGFGEDLRPDFVSFMKEAAKRPKSSVILLTHTAPKTFAEATLISNEVNKIEGRVFVIFIPVRRVDAEHTMGENEAVRKLKQAFKAQTEGASKNRIFMVAPDSSSADSGALAQFWSKELLNPQDDELYIVHRAMDIFGRGLLHAERRL